MGRVKDRLKIAELILSKFKDDLTIYFFFHRILIESTLIIKVFGFESYGKDR
jgi:hypothetical protein